uniref:G-protein coupled receptors family 1 profile domain-containing protein n=1 Tax=Globodera rostochiensis TaxID=31243 RepID=A0A914HAI9_GLORO
MAVNDSSAEDCQFISNCNASRWLEEAFQNSIDNTLIGMSLISMLANVLVIICANRLFTYNRDTIHIYIASMTFADLVLVACQVLESLESRHAFLGVVPCIFVYLLGWSGIAVSALSLVLLNGDKLLFFNFPIYYRVIKSVKRAFRMCALVWIISLSVPTSFWCFGILRIRDPNKCEMTINFELAPGMEHFYSLFITMFCICPILSSAVVSCYLLRLMRTKRQIVKNIQKNNNNNASSSLTGETCQAPAFSNKIRSLVFIFTTTVWTAISLLPFRLLMLYWMYLVDIDHFCAEQCQLLQWIYNAAWALLCVLKLNPIVNPFITSIIYHPYRCALTRRFSMPSGRTTRRSTTLSNNL